MFYFCSYGEVRFDFNKSQQDAGAPRHPMPSHVMAA